MSDDFSFSIDSDWKKQAQEEKRRLAEEAERKKAAASKPAATPAAPAGPQSAAAAAPSRRARRPRSGAGGGELPEASFETLVQTLASQALLYMGGVALSDGQGVLDLDTAKHHIDLMAVLEDKTAGNLSADEQRTLDVTLYETRMRYVSVASRYIL